MWQRWNSSTHIFEKSDDDGASYVALPLDAATITEGIFNVARIPSLPASKITSGTFDVARIPDLSATKITSDSLSDARLSSNVPLKNGTNAFTGANSFASSLLDLLVGQLKFPSTQNPSSNVNTLDDYEEGTWTPIDSSGAGLSLSVSGANYIKIGQLVIASTQLAYPGTASGANSLLGGLPFTSNGAQIWPVVFGYNDSGTALVAYVAASATTMLIYPAGSGTRRTNANLSGSTMIFHAIYRAAD